MVLFGFLSFNDKKTDVVLAGIIHNVNQNQIKSNQNVKKQTNKQTNKHQKKLSETNVAWPPISGLESQQDPTTD